MVRLGRMEPQLEGLLSHIEDNPRGETKETVHMVLDRLEQRFVGLAQQVRSNPNECPPDAIYRLAKGMEYLVRVLKKS